MKKLYKFDFDTYYSDTIGLFVADEAAVAAAIGQHIYLGEREGKHSEVQGPLEQTDLEIVTDDPMFVGQFERLFPRGFGINPLEYVEGGSNR